MTAILLHATRTAAPTATRGSGRRTSTRWFRAVTIHTETIYAADGEPLDEQKLIEGLNLEVASGGYFGWGEQAAIEAHVAEHYPGYELIDTWPIARPVTADEF